MSQIPTADLLSIFKCAARIRVVEQFIAKVYPQQQMRCPTHLCIGQEAVPAVFGHLAQKEDVFVGTYRSHGHYLAKGGDLVLMFAELLGSSKGCSGGMGGSMHLIDTQRNFMGTSAIVAGGVPIAAGAALSLKRQQQPYVAIAFTGDAALEEGIYYETVNFACLHKLPVIFVSENNQLAISTPLALRQAKTDLFNRFEALGLKGIFVRENDIEGLFQAATFAFEHASTSQEPILIEYSLSRMSVHVGHDIRGPIDGWWQDPLAKTTDPCAVKALARILIERQVLTHEQIKQLHEELVREVEQAYQKAQDEMSHSTKLLKDYVYASGLTSTLPKQSSSSRTEFNAVEPSKLINPF